MTNTGIVITGNFTVPGPREWRCLPSAEGWPADPGPCSLSIALWWSPSCHFALHPAPCSSPRKESRAGNTHRIGQQGACTVGRVELQVAQKFWIHTDYLSI